MINSSAAGAMGRPWEQHESEPAGRVTRFEVHGDDLDIARATYERLYHGQDFAIDAVDASFEFRLTSIGDDVVSVRSNRLHGTMTGAFESHGEYVLTWLTAGELVVDTDLSPVELTPGRTAVFSPGRMIRFRSRDHRQNLIHVNAGYLERVAAAERDEAVAPLRFNLHRPLPEAAAEQWAHTVQYVAAMLTKDETPPLQRAQLHRHLAATIVALFPHEVASPPPEPKGTPGLCRAIAFIHANAHLPMTIDDIAAAANLSVRGLQSAFHARMQIAPLQYLRQVRLDRAREELLMGERKIASVAAIANRWGFAHLGRFSGYYAERFGEPPNRTLRR